MALIDFIGKIHTATKRNYLERATSCDKAECAEVALRYGYEYWDGDRRYGYGGFRYDGRWRAVAAQMARHYGLKRGDRILDVGCGKAFLLYELTQAAPGVEVAGLDVSPYAIEHAKEEVKPFLRQGDAAQLPYEDASFDLVLSINTLHNLYNYALCKALKEIERVGKDKKYIVVETYENERQKANLLYWQLTCRAFHTPREWEWIFKQCGYSGDHSFVTFD
ncbi:MAG: class I SAM-dependent methyltransferase [Elusimicrobia bacterium]|nr:class I SAM-dependent methyltransferase [Elusimicrobiota bacterium]